MPDSLDLDQLHLAVTRANERYRAIRAKRPTLRAYLVFSSPRGQAPLTTSPTEILNAFPDMVVDNPTKKAVVTILSQIKKNASLAQNDKPEKIDHAKLQTLAQQIRFHGDMQIEIRFGQLDYELVRCHRVDELVDRELTPQIAPYASYWAPWRRLLLRSSPNSPHSRWIRLPRPPHDPQVLQQFVAHGRGESPSRIIDEAAEGRNVASPPAMDSARTPIPLAIAEFPQVITPYIPLSIGAAEKSGHDLLLVVP